jgi:hypothetical protein
MRRKGWHWHDPKRSNATLSGWHPDRFNQRLYLEAHRRLGVTAMKIDLKQASTKKGLALIGVAAPILVGLWELLSKRAEVQRD